MQGAADVVLREALDCYDDGAIEDSDLSVIGLALEQFHHAITDRRVVIGTGGADIPRMRAAPDLFEHARLFPSFSRNLAGCGATGPLGDCIRRPGNEVLTKQFPNATKPFWRFRANVLKRFICIGFPNDAPNWCDKQGDDHVQFIQNEPASPLPPLARWRSAQPHFPHPPRLPRCRCFRFS